MGLEKVRCRGCAMLSNRDPETGTILTHMGNGIIARGSSCICGSVHFDVVPNDYHVPVIKKEDLVPELTKEKTIKNKQR